jgi:protein-arginine kinase activator protein McsA
MFKTCTSCKQEKPLTEFYVRSASKDGRTYICRPCSQAKTKAHYAAHPEQWRNWQLRKEFGISLVEYKAILESQGGTCAICATPPRRAYALHVDHCHTTGKVRALLCESCNNGLGRFKDSIPTLLAAVEYLKRYQV